MTDTRATAELEENIERAISKRWNDPDEASTIIARDDLRELVRRLDEAEAGRDGLREALRRIASHPTEILNPDGMDQAAHEMQLLAREALGEDA